MFTALSNDDFFSSAVFNRDLFSSYANGTAEINWRLIWYKISSVLISSHQGVVLDMPKLILKTISY